MAHPKPLEFLELLAADRPELAEACSELAQLHQRKLWHQITLKVEQCFSQAAFNVGDLPVKFFNGFVADFAQKINLLKLAQFAVHASKFTGSPAGSIDFLDAAVKIIDEMKLPRSDEPTLFLRMHVAQHRLEMGSIPEAKALVEAGKEQLDSMSGTDPSVSAAVHYVASLYYKAVGDFAEFYRASLMYLSFVSSDALPADFKQRLAVDIGLAALLGEHIYSFGQLLQHPIVHALDEAQHAWLHELLVAFNDGNMHAYDDMCTKYAAQLNSQPALVENERRLREKITLMCLLALISSTPAEERNIPLDVIAQRTKLSTDGVEFLLMKALSLHLIEGTIDGVAGRVDVSWVAPRILAKAQIQELKGRLDGWIDRVAAITTTLEAESVGVVEA